MDWVRPWAGEQEAASRMDTPSNGVAFVEIDDNGTLLLRDVGQIVWEPFKWMKNKVSRVVSSSWLKKHCLGEECS